MDHLPLSNVTDEGRNETSYGTAGDVTNAARASTKKESDAISLDDTVPKKVEMTRVVTLAINALNHILIVGFTIYILVVSFQSVSLFSWHPSCMTVGTFLLMAEAVMSISPDNILTARLERQAKVRMHWILQAIAVAVIFIGFLSIVINKNRSNKKHYQSVHSIFGLITFILVIMTSLGGVFTLYSLKFRHLVRPVTVKLMHNILGTITYFIGAVSLFLGLYSGWFEGFSDGAKGICRTIVIVSAVATLMSPVKSIFYRLRNSFTST